MEGRSPEAAAGAAAGAAGSGSGALPPILDLMTAPRIRTPYPERMAPATDKTEIRGELRKQMKVRDDVIWDLIRKENLLERNCQQRQEQEVANPMPVDRSPIASN